MPVSGGTSCACPDSSYNIVSNQCVCPSQTTAYNGHCYSCTVQLCTVCQTDNICSTCTSPFVASTGGTSCVCPSGFVQSGNTCICPTGQV